MNKKETVEATKEIWQAVIDNKLINKHHAPTAQKYAFGCPCCQYVIDHGEHSSIGGMNSDECESHCPMWSAWPEGGCEFDDNSPYDRMDHAKCALAMVAAANKILEER